MKAFCPFCEKEYDNLEVQTRYEITTLNGVTAEWQKKYIVCPDCGEELYNGELHDANLRVVYAACKVPDIDKPVKDLCDYVLKLRMENAELRARLDNAIELPPGDRVWYIAQDEEGQESYIIPKPTSSLTVEELKYEMHKKYFPTHEDAEAKVKEIKENAQLRARQNKTAEFTAAIEARLKELKGKMVYTVIKNCTNCQHYDVSWAECTAPITANFDCESTHGTCFTQDIIDDECKKHLCVAKLEFDLKLLDPKTGKLKPQYSIEREAAEAQLKELLVGER